ncbi:MAG: fluoride efflux transporter CrcB [Chloroflexi bacterium]|nr:fluoride efflux transporter CrcB [Chloroflexota bacterium]
MYRVFWVGFGGFVGAILRYLVAGWVQRWTKGLTFPHGTLAVNLMSCFVIGLLSHLLESRGAFNVESRLFVFTCLLGAFTTFSTFGNETLNLFREGDASFALRNISVHVVLGLGMVWAGRTLAELVWR